VEVYPDIPKEIIRRIKVCQEKNKSEITGNRVRRHSRRTSIVAFSGSYQNNEIKESFRCFYRFDELSADTIPPGRARNQNLPSALFWIFIQWGLKPDFVLCRADKPATPDINAPSATYAVFQ